MATENKRKAKDIILKIIEQAGEQGVTVSQLHEATPKDQKMPKNINSVLDGLAFEKKITRDKKIRDSIYYAAQTGKGEFYTSIKYTKKRQPKATKAPKSIVKTNGPKQEAKAILRQRVIYELVKNGVAQEIDKQTYDMLYDLL